MVAAHPRNSYDQDDQEDCAKPAADIGAAIVASAAIEQDQQDDDKDYQVHDDFVPGATINAKPVITGHALNSDERSTMHRNGLPRMDDCRSYRHAATPVAGGPVSGGTGRAHDVGSPLRIVKHITSTSP